MKKFLPALLTLILSLPGLRTAAWHGLTDWPPFATATTSSPSEGMVCPPPDLSTLSATNITTTYARLNCSVTGVMAYYWRYRATGDPDWIDLGGTQEGFIGLYGLQPSSSYQFQVSVRCSNTEISDWSAARTFTTLTNNAGTCSSPTLVQCNGAYTGNNSTGINTFSAYSIGNMVLTGQNGPEVIHQISLATTTNISINLTGLTADLDLILLTTNCSSNSAIAWSAAYNLESEHISINSGPGRLLHHSGRLAHFPKSLFSTHQLQRQLPGSHRRTTVCNQHYCHRSPPEYLCHACTGL